MHGDVRASDADRYAANSRDPWLAAEAARSYSTYQTRQGWARLRRRVLLGLAVVTLSGAALVSLLIAVVVFHGGWLGIALVVLLALGALVVAAAASLAWIAWRMWRRGAWLEALPLLAGAAVAQPRGVGGPPAVDGSRALASARAAAPGAPVLSCADGRGYPLAGARSPGRSRGDDGETRVRGVQQAEQPVQRPEVAAAGQAAVALAGEQGQQLRLGERHREVGIAQPWPDQCTRTPLDKAVRCRLPSSVKSQSIVRVCDHAFGPLTRIAIESKSCSTVRAPIMSGDSRLSDGGTAPCRSSSAPIR